MALYWDYSQFGCWGSKPLLLNQDFDWNGYNLSTPKTEKFHKDCENDSVRYGLSSMQGWRTTMEDASSLLSRTKHEIPSTISPQSKQAEKQSNKPFFQKHLTEPFYGFIVVSIIPDSKRVWNHWSSIRSCCFFFSG